MKIFGFTITKGDSAPAANVTTTPSPSDAPDHVKTAALTVFQYLATHPEIIKAGLTLVAAAAPNSDEGRVAGQITGAFK